MVLSFGSYYVLNLFLAVLFCLATVAFTVYLILTVASYRLLS
mgnify:CR=1 FL=1